MSLISNLRSPFTRATPVVTIVLVAVLFLVFRLSGGSVSVERGSSRLQERSDDSRAISTSPVRPRITEEQRRQEDVERSGTITMSEAEAEDFMRKVLENRRAREAVAESASEAEQRRRGGLDDIERDLGLR